MDSINIDDYAKFVDTTTSEASKDTTKMCDRVEYLRGTYSMKGGEVIDQEIDMARLMTALIGMLAESGEFAEVVKKKVFQSDSKFKSDEIFHMKRELGRCIVVLVSRLYRTWIHTTRGNEREY